MVHASDTREGLNVSPVINVDNVSESTDQSAASEWLFLRCASRSTVVFSLLCSTSQRSNRNDDAPPTGSLCNAACGAWRPGAADAAPGPARPLDSCPDPGCFRRALWHDHWVEHLPAGQPAEGPVRPQPPSSISASVVAQQCDLPDFPYLEQHCPAEPSPPRNQVLCVSGTLAQPSISQVIADYKIDSSNSTTLSFTTARIAGDPRPFTTAVVVDMG